MTLTGPRADFEQPKGVRVPLLGGRLDTQQLDGTDGTASAPRAEPTAAPGADGEVAAIATRAVEVDDSAAIRAFGRPVAMVGADHSSASVHAFTV